MKALTDEQIRSATNKYLFESNSPENREKMAADLLKLYEDKKFILKDITTDMQVDAGICYFVASDGNRIQTILIMPSGILIR